jgi:hypothetical protein
MPGDGSLLRGRVDAESYRLYRQRIANPGPDSDFTNWLEMEQVSNTSGIALASQGTTVLLFYVGTDQRTIYYRESTDYGAGFGSATAILTGSSGGVVSRRSLR